MKTSTLIPTSTYMEGKVKNWNSLIFLGKANLRVCRSEWRKNERELSEKIKHLQELVDTLDGGPKNIKLIEIVQSNDKDFLQCFTEYPYIFRGKKGALTFCRCAGCRYSREERNGYGTCKCTLLERIGAKSQRIGSQSCAFYSECKDGNRRLIRNLNREKNKLLAEKRKIAGKIKTLSKAIDEASEKPLLPYLRDTSYFDLFAEGMVFSRIDGDLGPHPVKIKGRTNDLSRPGFVDYEPKPLGPVELNFSINIHSPEIVTMRDYRYLSSHPSYCKFWLGMIPDKGMRETLWERFFPGRAA